MRYGPRGGESRKKTTYKASADVWGTPFELILQTRLEFTDPRTPCARLSGRGYFWTEDITTSADLGRFFLRMVSNHEERCVSFERRLPGVVFGMPCATVKPVKKLDTKLPRTWR